MTDPTSPAPSLGTLIAARYSRRDALRGSASAAAMTMLGGSLLAACSKSDDGGSSDPGPTVTATASPTTVTAGNRVTITATATDNGSVSSSTFVQVSGPVVSLSATTGLTTSFIAPSATAGSIVVIRFTATDNLGTTNSTDVNVTVNAVALSFTAVAKNRNDVVTVPAGYAVSVLYRTGDPITAAAPAYRNDGTDTDFASRAGDQGAGFTYFGLQASAAGVDVSSNTRGVLTTAHEGITQAYLHPAGPTSSGGARPEAEVLKEMEAHGVSLVEIAAGTTGAFATVPASALNRRVTPLTAVTFNGPVRGNALLQTAFSPAGTDGRGTIGNSVVEQTAWGTALVSEEKWARYFARPSSDNAARSAKEVTSLNRYGLSNAAGLYGWSTVATTNTAYQRWNAAVRGASATADFRNEPNQFGWVTEIDPYSTATTVRKRTALGRLAHAGIAPSLFVVGVKPAIYMGDDADNEYLYKFVSGTAWASADAAATDRLATGNKYLDTGTLYVAKFAADGTGTWVPLTFGTAPLTAANAAYPFADQADVLTNARLAGDAVAATPMDRPDWTAVRQTTGEVFVSLNGNAARTTANLNAPNPRAYVDPPSAAVGNRNGHILRLREAASSESTTFNWDIYVLGAGADLDATNINASALDASNDFSGPEGLRFARPSNAAGLGTPLMWIQTDDTAYRDVTNAMMLASLPGSVGDGGDKTITNGTVTQATKLGKAPGALLKRFLVGPVEAAVTGFDSTPDGRTVFVNIQHPGENGTAAAPTSAWPASQSGGTGRPRSATVVITRTDGGVVGL